MKDYLGKEERIDVLYLKKYADVVEKMLTEWGSRNNLSKEESKAIKTSLTWGMKAWESILERLNDTAITQLYKSLNQCYIHIEDRYSSMKFRQKLDSDLKAAYEDNKDYYKLIELILDKNCKDCKIDCKKCEIYKEFEEHMLPEPGDVGMYKSGTCRYSYTLELTEQEKKEMKKFLDPTSEVLFEKRMKQRRVLK